MSARTCEVAGCRAAGTAVTTPVSMSTWTSRAPPTSTRSPVRWGRGRAAERGTLPGVPQAPALIRQGAAVLSPAAPSEAGADTEGPGGGDGSPPPALATPYKPAATSTTAAAPAPSAAGA